MVFHHIYDNIDIKEQYALYVSSDCDIVLTIVWKFFIDFKLPASIPWVSTVLDSVEIYHFY